MTLRDSSLCVVSTFRRPQHVLCVHQQLRAHLDVHLLRTGCDRSANEQVSFLEKAHDHDSNGNRLIESIRDHLSSCIVAGAIRDDLRALVPAAIPRVRLPEEFHVVDRFSRGAVLVLVLGLLQEHVHQAQSSSDIRPQGARERPLLQRDVLADRHADQQHEQARKHEHRQAKQG